MLLLLSHFSHLYPPPLKPPNHSLRQCTTCCPCPWVIHKCFLATLFLMLYFASLYSVTTNLYFLIPHPFWSVPQYFPSGNHQNVLCIYDSVTVLLLCLFCSLDSIVDRHISVAILLFICFIFFIFLRKAL